MHKRKYAFILLSIFILLFCMELFDNQKILLISLCIIFETGVYFILLKPQIRTAIIFSFFLCLLTTVRMIVEVLTKVNGEDAILNEINNVLNISVTSFIIVMLICIGEILIIKKVRENHEKNF